MAFCKLVRWALFVSRKPPLFNGSVALMVAEALWINRCLHGVGEGRGQKREQNCSSLCNFCAQYLPHATQSPSDGIRFGLSKQATALLSKAFGENGKRSLMISRSVSAKFDRVRFSVQWRLRAIKLAHFVEGLMPLKHGFEEEVGTRETKSKIKLISVFSKLNWNMTEETNESNWQMERGKM